MEASRCSRDVALSFRDSCRNASNAARDGYAVLGKRGKDWAPLSIKASSKISDPRHHQQQQCRRHGLLLSPECLSSVQLYILPSVVRDLPIKWRRNLPCDSRVHAWIHVSPTLDLLALLPCHTRCKHSTTDAMLIRPCLNP
jgi:hypothetical protein